jgi:alkaline phosphatase D
VLRRAAAYQAYYEHMPLRAASRPAGSHMRLFRRLRFGNLIDLHLLDTRQWRSDQPCGAPLANRCAGALAPTQTMMGAEQEAWLFRNLARPLGRWTVISQQVPMFALDRRAVDPNARFSMDKWDGYVAARQRLFRRLRDTRAPNPIVLSGDLHRHYASDLKLDFEAASSPTIGVEFTNTSISSNGDGSDVSADWPKVRADNPHIKYHSSRRGYIACAATPRELRAEFKILDRVSVPGQPVRVGGTVVVEAGRPGAITG